MLGLLMVAECRCCILQKADAEAAKLYEDFVESFAEDPAEKGPKAFVRGEVIQPGQRPSDSGVTRSLSLLKSAGHTAKCCTQPGACCR